MSTPDELSQPLTRRQLRELKLTGQTPVISAEEIEDATRSGAVPVTLGPRILRAETAAIASAAVVMALWGDV